MRSLTARLSLLSLLCGNFADEASDSLAVTVLPWLAQDSGQTMALRSIAIAIVLILAAASAWVTAKLIIIAGLQRVLSASISTTMLCILLLLWRPDPVTIMVVIAILIVLEAPLELSSGAIAPALADRADIRRVTFNSVSLATAATATLIAPLLAAPLHNNLGDRGLLWLVAGLGILGVLSLLAMLPMAKSPVEHHTEHSYRLLARKHFWLSALLFGLVLGYEALW